MNVEASARSTRNFKRGLALTWTDNGNSEPVETTVRDLGTPHDFLVRNFVMHIDPVSTGRVTH